MFVQTHPKESARRLLGLVLIGGQARRMGRDKSLIALDGIPLRTRMAELLAQACEEVRFSCRADQATNLQSDETALLDRFPDAGPLGALLSAFAQEPGVDWLVLPTDVPGMNREAINKLCTIRAADRASSGPLPEAWLARSDERPMPEPLIGIWTPEAAHVLQDALESGDYAVWKTLAKLRIHEVPLPEAALLNLNRPEDWERWQKDRGALPS
jgi:molybdopterin-guanine dinucleotide biosynthesis protein A